ncbi:hypothetical protein [Achromobacter aegrifaciens]|uniref:hypothetical protein n=1 Tax=Achromobacter aegrifaciens TaxID=1287736 RepID=UPI000F74192A|nr:hypothetical protein [Achromobacter aegrifaciens]RSF09289.1 hypothetical protein EGU54_00195 [Achromobacter aegrifaciens]
MSKTDKEHIIAAFITMRRHARDARRILSNLHDLRCITDRQLRLAKAKVAAGHLSTAVAADIRAHNEDIRRRISIVKGEQVKIGEILHEIFRHLDILMTLDERCDLFNINPVHRQWEGDSDPLSLDLIMVYGLEDSADRHDPDAMDGPLWACLHANMWDFFTKDIRGRAALDFMTDVAFAPGGPFEHVTLQRIGPDGAVEDVPPSERAKAPDGTTLH